jgi:PE family
MSFVIAAPELVRAAAEDLAGLRASLSDAAGLAAGATTGMVPAAADEVSAAISAMFGKFGQEFQGLSAQAQAFHAEFVKLMNAGAGAYASAEIANAERAVANVVNGPAVAGAGAAQSVSAAGLLGGILGSTSGGPLLGGLTGGAGGLGGLLGGLTGGTGGLGGLLGGSPVAPAAFLAAWVHSEASWAPSET